MTPTAPPCAECGGFDTHLVNEYAARCRDCDITYTIRWITRTQTGRRCFHKTRDCGRFSTAEHRKMPRRPDQLPNLRMCRQCAGEYEQPPQSGPNLATRLHNLDADAVGGD